MLRALIADDERPARAKIKRLLAVEDGITVVAEASDGIEALELVEETSPDLLFLDVRMPGADGFDVLGAIAPEREVAVIFSTAHDEHALRAFDAHAVDYLLKPYDASRFAAAVAKARRHVAGRAPMPPPPIAERRLVVRTDAGFVAVEVGDVVRVSAEDKWSLLHTRTETIRVRAGVGQLEARLDPARFLRVHRGEIVRLDAVVAYAPSAHGDGVLTLVDGSAVVLSRTRREGFRRRFERE